MQIRGLFPKKRLSPNLLHQQPFLCMCSRYGPVSLKNKLNYIQGQSPSETNMREYFYYIDHQGQLFLDDSKMKNFTSCFKDKSFLAFFFKRLRMNTTDRYQVYFPYISLCGRERNYVRCDDLPIVFTEILLEDSENGIPKEYLSYCNGGKLLTVDFSPSFLSMDPWNGRVYYSASKLFGGRGLVKSALAVDFSQYFLFEKGADQPPTSIVWKGKSYHLVDHGTNFDTVGIHSCFSAVVYRQIVGYITHAAP